MEYYTFYSCPHAFLEVIPDSYVFQQDYPGLKTPSETEEGAQAGKPDPSIGKQQRVFITAISRQHGEKEKAGM